MTMVCLNTILLCSHQQRTLNKLGIPLSQNIVYTNAIYHWTDICLYTLSGSVICFVLNLSNLQKENSSVCH